VTAHDHNGRGDDHGEDPVTEASHPLQGVRVLDFTQVMFGPAATQVLADFGADVIKVERPGAGDISRAIDQEATRDGGESSSFVSLNRSKRSISVDLRTAEGKALVQELLPQVDVLTHNFRPGVAERLGIGFAEIHERFPAIVYAAGSGFGPHGPLASKGGQDMLAQSLSGAALHARDLDGRPQLYPITHGDFASGMILVQGILLALLHRERTGRGQLVEVSLLDTMLAAQMQEITQWSMRRFEVNFLSQYLAGVFRTSDGWVTTIGVFRENPLRAICAALEVEDLSARPEFATSALELENRDRLFAELDAAFLLHSTAECLRRLDERDILCAPVLDYDEVLGHPQIAANGSLIDLPTAAGEIRTIGSPIQLSGTPRRAPGRPPALGEHTVEVLTELGVDPERIEALLAGGVIARPAAVAGA
jgi:crotonobetainyl-CoA:carnitine CoA-transferase CaiB-like acyl-CoA transferase